MGNKITFVRRDKRSTFHHFNDIQSVTVSRRIFKAGVKPNNENAINLKDN
jgi:hypothetical protein